MQRRPQTRVLAWLTFAAFLGGAALGFLQPQVLEAIDPAGLPGVVPAAPLSPVAPVAPAEPATPAEAHPVTMVTMLA